MTDVTTSLAADFPPAAMATWRTLVDKVLEGADFDKRLVARTADRIAVQPLYTRADLPAGSVAVLPLAHGGGAPGWDIRQRHAEPDPDKANAAILEDLAGGVASITLQIDSPGQAGLSYRADPIARALAGVLLDVCPIALDARENTMDAAGSVIALWRQAGIAPERRLGSFNLDPLGTLARTGSLYYPPAKSLDLAATFLADAMAMPGVRALAADGRPYHEAGASEGQELAALLATLVATLRACEARGVAPGQASGKIALHLAADADLFLTIAKLRAARRLAGRVLEACGAGDAAASIHISVTTSERMMARRDPWVNMLRTTAACAGAAFGGADAITVLPFTWPRGLPDAFARRVARNTHIVLLEEAGLGRVSDPAGGAFAIEAITADLARTAWSLFQAIEARGGMAEALVSGSIQDAIAVVAAARDQAIANGREELTGVSAFPRLGDDSVTVTPWPLAAPLAPGAVAARPLAAHRLAAPFEALRDAADAHTRRTGAPPRVFLAALGPLSGHAARVTWTRNFLAAGGIEAVATAPVHASAEAGLAFAESGASIACMCGPDAVYAEIGEAVAGALAAAGARKVYLAGRPKAQIAALEAAGVGGCIFAGADAVAELRQMHAALGVGGGTD